MKRLLGVLLGLMLVVGCADSGSAPSAAPESGSSSAAVGANLQTVVFNVPGMTWPTGCAPRVRATLADQPGVKDVEIEFEARKAVCKIESGDTFDADKAIAALDEEGFEESTVAK